MRRQIPSLHPEAPGQPGRPQRASYRKLAVDIRVDPPSREASHACTTSPPSGVSVTRASTSPAALAIALLLAALEIYGVMTEQVRARNRKMGIRDE